LGYLNLLIKKSDEILWKKAHRRILRPLEKLHYKDDHKIHYLHLFATRFDTKCHIKFSSSGKIEKIA
jgi:hypothetical protein